MATLERRLRRETRGSVLFDAASRGRYSTDASIYQIFPLGVFIPTDERDISAALGIARELEIPVLARGAGTSQCGQTVGRALVIDVSRHFKRIVEVDTAARTAIVEPGVVLDQLNAQLKKHGLWFPVDVSTSAQATLGGMAGNNSCGSRSIAYGNMVHNVLGVSAWLSDGSTVEFGPVGSLGGRAAEIAAFVRQLAQRHQESLETQWPKVLRRVGGYNLDLFEAQGPRAYTTDGSANLAHLLIGSEGTLAFTRQLKLQLAPLPRGKVLGAVNFPSFRAAMEAAQHIVRLGPVAVELLDRNIIELSSANPAFRPTIERALIGRPEAVLLVEFAGDDLGALPAKLTELEALVGDLGLPDGVVKMTDAGEQGRLWEVRKAGLNIMMSLKGDGKPVSFIEDCAVPLEHLADYTGALTDVFAKYGTRGTWYAHASVGTLHVRPILDMRVAGPNGGVAKMRAIAQEAAQLVRRYKGAYSGEHGDGLCRGEWIEWQFGPALNDAFRAIKRHLDPLGLFNPGKIIDPPKMDDVSLLRFPPPTAPHPYQTMALEPALDWSAWNVQNDPTTEEITAPGTGGDTTGGFAKAVEMCNNNGHCRKFDAGTMCPSYRVTLDEQHLTRGRANTLRLALSGQLGNEGLTGNAMREAMDLCVSCKGCRRECPTGVDMARMKVEFLAQYKAKHGFTLRDRLIAHLPDYAETASRFSWLFNLRDTIPGLAWLSERLVGFAAKRPLPKWRADTFFNTARSNLRAAGAGEPFSDAATTLAAHAAHGKAAVLFVDTFNGVFETETALAAARVLRSAGYTLHTVRKDRGHYCCGRTFLAVGKVKEARARSGELIAALGPFARAGVPIVGLEPSCLLTLRDEALVMRLGEDAAVVAKQSFLFEEFLSREIRAGRCSLDLDSATAPIVVHGHCHQKAFGIAGSVVELLSLIPGATVKALESSCCGMAGSFGYEAEHHEMSVRMGEAGLLPAVRSAEGAIVVAAGTSCRRQILDGTGRDALHAAALLDGLLKSSPRANGGR
ncbi:MAG TPA: FAD-linked oxidase C-terminal domain-containing protein [Steroidobacteraceae bacterium]|jgi:FAD/FMN-containing dehydrogenase/Fe-S oxidoreductase